MSKFEYKIDQELFDKVLQTVSDVSSPEYQKGKDDETLVREYLADYVDWSGDDYLENKDIQWAYTDWTDDEDDYLWQLAKNIVDDYDLPDSIKRYVNIAQMANDLSYDIFIGDNGWVFER